MVTNSNTKQLPYQVNTFAKGMDADTSDSLISNDSYRIAENLRYITDIDETTGELRLIEGAIKINQSKTDGGNQFKDEPVIRAFCSIRNIGAVICESADKSWAVFRIEYNDNKYTPELVFGWCTDKLSSDTKVSTTIKYEDSDKVQLYIADGKHSLMKINLYDKTKSSDIRYVSNGLLFSNLNKVQIDSIISGGQLEAGLVQYSYRLYNNNNIATQIAPLSSVKAITNQHTEIGAIGLEEQERSSVGLRIKVKIAAPEVYSKIQLYRIQYLINGQLPKIQLICDEKISVDANNFYTYDDLGGASLQELTSEEFNSLTGIYIQPSVIESKNNILFAGNVKYDIDVLDGEYLNKDFRAFSSGDKVNGVPVTINTIPAGNVINENLDFNEEYNEDSWKTIKPNYTSTIGGYGPNIEWKFGDGKMGVSGSMFEINRFPLNQTPEISDLRIQNDRNKVNNSVVRGLRHDEIYRYGIVLYSKHGTKYPVKWIADIRTPNIDQHLHAANEEANIVGSLSHIGGNDGNKYELAHILYPVFKIHEGVLNSEKISGYEIVRVHRGADDMATVAQGVIASTVKKSTTTQQQTPKEVSSSGLPFLDHVIYTNDYKKYPPPVDTLPRVNLSNPSAETDIDVLQFYSPETTYQSDDVMQILKKDDSLYLQCIYPLTSVCTQYNRILRDRTFDAYVKDGDEFKKVEENYLTDRMYYYKTTFYKLFYGFLNNRRFKWFVPQLAETNFLDVDERIPSYGRIINKTDIYEDLFGLNVYKLHRHPMGMPTSIWQGKNSLASTPPRLKYNIKDFSIVNHIDYNKLIDDDSFNGKDYQSTVGDYTFFNCVAPFIVADTSGGFNVNKLKKDADQNEYRDELIATCDTSLALSFDDEFRSDPRNVIANFYRDDNYLRPDTDTNERLYEYSMLCNIRRNIIPYGGFSKYSRDHSTYTQHGYYFSSDYTGDIEMFDGDTTVSTYEFVTAHKWYDATHVSPRATVVCQVAVESSIDMDLDAGDRFSNNTQENPTLVQVQPCNFNNEYIQKKPSYVYNTAYSIDPQLLLVNYSLDTIENSLKDFDCRVHYSNPSSNNQASDPWLIFQPLNYLDVDTKYGPITNLRTFKNELIFWQERAAGVLSVNERVQIATESNLPLILGTGGVLERYDYLTTNNGMKQNQHADAQSDSTLYWWDYDNNTICAYTKGNIPVQLSKAKSVQNILNRGAKNKKLIDSNIEESSYPIVAYDNKYNEVLFKVGALGDSDDVNTIVYSERQAQFSSIYDIDPQCYFDIDRTLKFVHRDDNQYNMYQWNAGYDEGSYGFGYRTLLPYIKYIINDQSTVVKVYDNAEFAGTIPNSYNWDKDALSASTLTEDINFTFNTPLKQTGKIDGTKITNRQLDFKFAIPRSGYQDSETGNWITKQWGDRMRGKTMQCEMSSKSNSLNFSLQYIITKYRISWS